MLINLQIKDFLLIEQLELDFYTGLTVITGETGSGKSITIDALMIIFGAKVNTDIIRTNQSNASFSATFEVNNSKILTWLREREYLDSDEENTIICRRVLDQNGRSKAYINSLPVTLGVMKELGEMLLDIHTQHASIALLKTDNQRTLLDEFAGHADNVAILADKYNAVRTLQDKLESAREFSQDLVIKQEILNDKIQDLTNLSLQVNEWEELQIEQKQLANAGLILQELDYSLNYLNGEQKSVSHMIRSVNSRLAKIGEYLPNYAQIEQLCDSIETEVAELEHELQITANNIEQDPAQLANIDERIDEIYSIARKYRIRPEDIHEQLIIWQNELSKIVADTDLDKLESELNLAYNEYLTLAKQISERRHVVAKQLSNNVSKLLHKLAISGEFKIQIESNDKQQNSYGIDSIQYLVCFNQGMQLQALNKVASGGELSRVALALYVTLSINNPPEVIVFDEIDVGIGGGVAETVGTLLKELGTSKQVICITHQPQTACCGNYHLLVQKQTVSGSTQSSIAYATEELRISEIARMLGGLQITTTTIQHAKEMLKIV